MITPESRKQGQPKSILDEILAIAEEKGASDIQISAGAPPAVRVNGILSFIEDFHSLTPMETKDAIMRIMEDRQAEILKKKRQVDFSFGWEKARYRVNVYYQRGSLAASFRRLKMEIPSLEKLHLPPYLKEYVYKKQGLIIVSGPTGSGKSTTVASLLKIATNRGIHILTIEDPIEYLIPHGASIVDQREVGTDVPTFHDGMVAAMRENPDLVFIGEVRDPESADTVLSLADTGHLVITTIHAFPAKEVVNRILSLLAEKDWNRKTFAMNLVAIISQRLIQTNCGIMPVTEIVERSKAVESVISEGRLQELETYMNTGRNRTLRKSLEEMRNAGCISNINTVIDSF